MSKLLSYFFIPLAVMAMSAVNAMAEPTSAPEGEYEQYLSECNYSLTGSAWNHSNTMIQNVVFENGKLYIQNLCGAGWAVGSVNEEEHYAVFQLPQQVNDSHTLYAYIDGGDEIELNEVIFDFSADRTQINLRNQDGKRVILKAATTWGALWWKDVKLTIWKERPATPPTHGELSYLNMEYTNSDGTYTRLVEMVVNGKEVWMKNLIESGYLKGEFLENGDIRFRMPQYMGLNGNFIKYTFGLANGNETEFIDLMAQADGGYVLKEGVQLWGGELSPEYCLISGATFIPVDVYTGSPLPPLDAIWSVEYDNCFDFMLIPKGNNGENIPLDWLYWQVLIDGEPFTFTLKAYPELQYSVGEDVDMIQASSYFFTLLPSYFSLDWGYLGNNQYRCYLPGFSDQDNVSVRIGYKIDDNPVRWSEAVKVVKEDTPNSLPEDALYFGYVLLDTPNGPNADNGIAMYAEYGSESMHLSGFFGLDGKVEATYTDDLHRQAVMPSNQVIGTADNGQPITLIPATAVNSDPSDPYSSLLFTPVEEITWRLGPDGKNVEIKTPDVYLLAVIGKEIVNVWCPGLRLSLVADKVNEIPSSAIVKTHEMEYGDIRGDELTTEILMATEGDDVWIEFDVQSNWFDGEDTFEQLCLAGKKVNDSLVFNLPQFIGVKEGYISYVTADSWSFRATELVFEKDEESNSYVSDQEIWIGTGEGYPIWLAAEQMRIHMKNVSMKEVNAEESVRFVNGAFTDSMGNHIKVFNLSGMELVNRNLNAGTYIIIVNGNAKKVSIR